MLENFFVNVWLAITIQWGKLLLRANAVDILALCAFLVAILIAIVVVAALVRGESPMALLLELEKIFATSLRLNPKPN